MSHNTQLGDVISEWTDAVSLPPVTNDIQVWRVQRAACSVALEDLLTQEERLRAERIRAGEPRELFTTGRAALRLLLGHALSVAPTAVTVSSNQHGKLALPTQLNLHFNVAHSREIILIALTRSGPIGIDVEALDRTVDVIEIARTALSANEILQLRQRASGDDQLLAFFRCWTRKEAVVKADGCGLSVPLTAFDVPMSDARGGDVQIPPHDRCAGDTVRVGEIVPGHGYIGAVAGRWRNQQIVGYSLSSAALTRLISQATR